MVIPPDHGRYQPTVLPPCCCLCLATLHGSDKNILSSISSSAGWILTGSKRRTTALLIELMAKLFREFRLYLDSVECCLHQEQRTDLLSHVVNSVFVLASAVPRAGHHCGRDSRALQLPIHTRDHDRLIVLRANILLINVMLDNSQVSPPPTDCDCRGRPG